jgi:uncharacterized membrane protein
MAKQKSKNTKSGSKKEIKILGINVYYIIIVLALICFVFSALINFEKKYYETGEKSICTVVTDGNGCQLVQTSKYAQIFGVNNPWYGIAGFFVLALAAFLFVKTGKDNFEYIVLLGSLMAGLMAIYFLYVQTFLLQIYCIFCVIVDIISLIILGLAKYIVLKRVRSK